MVTPTQRRKAATQLCEKGLTQRLSCRTVGISRSTLLYQPRRMEAEKAFAEAVKAMSERYPRFGYRRIAVMLGWERNETVNPKRVYRFWKELGLALPKRRPRRKRPGQTTPLPVAVNANHTWSYDFVSDRCANGQKLKILAVVDEHTRECLALEVAGSIKSHHLINTLGRLMALYGKPKYLRSDNGPEFTAKAVLQWLTDNQIGPAFIKPGSPWQNAYVESFNGKFRDECLSREWFLNRQDAQRIIEQWRKFYNHERPHSSLGNMTPAQAGNRDKVA